MYGFSSFYFYFLLFYIFYAIIISIIYINKRRSVSQLFLLFLPLFILAALRGNTVGGDMASHYLPNFQAACDSSSFDKAMSVSAHEPGFRFLTVLVGYISHSDRAFIATTAILSLIGPFFLIYRYSPNYFISIIIYYMLGYYTSTFNNIRQALAVSLFFLCIPYLINKKPWKYCFAILLASMFHYSALALLFIYPFVKTTISIKKIVATFVFGVSTYFVLGSSIVYTVISIFFIKYDPELALEEKGGAGWNLLVMYLLLFFLFCFIYYKKNHILKKEENELLSLLLLFHLISIIFQLFATIYSSATRMGQYFFIPAIILIPYIGSMVKSKIIKMCYFLFFSCYCLYMVNKVYSLVEDVDNNKQGVIPYVFIDEKNEIF